MSGGRLPPRLEVPAVLRRAESQGGFATVLGRGDPESGAMLLVVTSRGRHVGCLERILGMGGAYEWRTAGPAKISRIGRSCFIPREAKAVRPGFMVDWTGYRGAWTVHRWNDLWRL